MTRSDAVTFLQRTTFGGSTADVDHLISLGTEAWFAEQIAMDTGDTHLNRRLGGDIRFASSLWGHYLGGEHQLRLRYSYALSQIFVASDATVNALHIANYADLLEANCFGTYRQLIETVTRSAAMGEFLTYDRNRREDARRGRVPDENYAREILQLFSIGLWELNLDGSRRLDGSGQPIPAYDQDDILGLARVFTGFITASVSNDPASAVLPMYSVGSFSEAQHETGEKRFLGVVIPASETRTLDESLEVAFDTLDNHPNTAPFISHQLIQRLVTSNPSPAYVQRVAEVFVDDGSGVRGNLAAVLEAVVLDEEAWQPNPPATFGKLREPVLRFTTITRALNVQCDNDRWLISSLSNSATELGQQPYESPSVFNFYRPGYVPPQTPLADAGLVSPEMQIANETTAIGWVNYLAQFLDRPPAWSVAINGVDTLVTTSFEFDDLISIVAMADLTAVAAGELVDELAARLCPGGISATLREVIIRRTREVFDDRYDPDEPEGRRQVDVHRERIAAAVVMLAVSIDFLHEGIQR